MNKETVPLKYVSYVRRSIVANKNEEDRGVPSLESQATEIKELAERYGLTIVKEYKETVSGHIPGARPEFAKMMEYLKSGKANAIVCFKMDRLGRNSIDEGTIKHYLQTGVILQIRATDRVFNTDDHTLLWAVEFSASTQSSRDLKKHIKRGQNQALRRGFRPSIAPIGYRNSKHREQGVPEEILIDEVNAPILRKMFDMVLTGEYTPFQVLKKAHDEWGFRSRKTRKYPKGRLLSKASWYNILANPFYYGEFEYPHGSGNWVQGAHKPIITKQEFIAIQQTLRKDAPRPKKHDYAYVGLMRCGECGARITCEAKTKMQKNGNRHYYVYYRCTGQVDPNCTQTCVREDRLEEQMIAYLQSLYITKDLHDWAVHELTAEYEREKKDKHTILHSQHAELTKVRGMLQNLFDMRMAGDIDSDRYKQEKGRLETEEARLAGEVEAIELRRETWLVDAKRLLTFSHRAVEVFKSGSKEKRRAIIAALGTEHILLDKKLTIHAEEPLAAVQTVVLCLALSPIPLEPVKNVTTYYSNGKKIATSTRLWRWWESHPRAYEEFVYIYEG